MQIYWIRAQAPRRVLAVARHLRLDVEYIEKDLMAGEMKKPDYAALNPNMKAPTLIDGEFRRRAESRIRSRVRILWAIV